MDSINDAVLEYTTQLRKGQIQKAYKGIMGFMSGLGAYFEKRCPEYIVSGLYYGYMDMTYFALTPADLKQKKLKIAVVYLHEQGKFEVWLAASNRKIQAEYIKLLRRKDTGKYALSEVLPGVDSIIETILVEQPDFDHPEELKEQMAAKIIPFVDDMRSLLA